MTARRSAYESALVLGGAGLVGYQVAKKLAETVRPRKLVIHSLFRAEVLEAVAQLRESFPDVEVRGFYGNLFARGRPIPLDEETEQRHPMDQMEDSSFRWDSFEDTFEDFDQAYRESCLTRLLINERPDVVVDSVNTATGISYKDVFTTSHEVGQELKDLQKRSPSPETLDRFLEDVEKLLVSVSIPQLILHIRMLNRAFQECDTKIYLKVGTTGTGGMGLNIPYTHGEDRPSPTLMAKNAIAFAHTGLLFLMARTPDAPIVKELKPAAMIGYRNINYQVVRGRQIRRLRGKSGDRYEWVSNEPYTLYRSHEETLGTELDTTPDLDSYESLREADGTPKILKLPVVNTGENGFFTRGEFEAITHVNQMEFMTPEEIAEVAVLEVLGANTGKDVITAVDSAVMSPTYKAGTIRHVAIQELKKLEHQTGSPSIALGQLGPPQLAKYLYETHLFRVRFRTLKEILGEQSPGGGAPTPAAVETRAEELSSGLFEYIRNSPLRNIITSVGIPILCPDGRTLIRGPFLRIPGFDRTRPIRDLTAERLDSYARRGWVDLRPSHMAWWLDNIHAMRMSVFGPGAKMSSEQLGQEAYLSDEIEMGEVVAWVFNNRLDPPGHRVK